MLSRKDSGVAANMCEHSLTAHEILTSFPNERKTGWRSSKGRNERRKSFAKRNQPRARATGMIYRTRSQFTLMLLLFFSMWGSPGRIGAAKSERWRRLHGWANVPSVVWMRMPTQKEALEFDEMLNNLRRTWLFYWWGNLSLFRKTCASERPGESAKNWVLNLRLCWF